LDLRSASPIYNLEAGHGARIAVRRFDSRRKSRVTERPRNDAFDDRAFECRRRVFGKSRIPNGGGLAQRCHLSEHPSESGAQDQVVFRIRDRSDSPADGIRWVRTGPKDGDVEKVLVSVKGGEHVGSAMVRDLKGTVEREAAAGGLFLTLAEPTREMQREAAASGFFETGFGRYPRMQIRTAAARPHRRLSPRPARTRAETAPGQDRAVAALRPARTKEPKVSTRSPSLPRKRTVVRYLA
jgi:hypothetical protein